MVSVGLSTMTILLVSHLKVYDKHAAGRHPTRFYDSNDAPLVVDPAPTASRVLCQRELG